MRLFRQLTVNDERLERFPYRRELSMQAYILEHPELLKLDDMYDDVQTYEDEIPIKDGGRNKDGRIDMVATYSGEHIAIIEFKNTELLAKHLDQLKGYLDQKEQLKDLEPPILSKDQTENPKWIGILVGTSIAPDLAQEISNGHSHKNIPIAAITIDRFRSATGNVYVTTDTYFKSNVSGRDNTKYEFNDETYGKGRLVLAIVQAHVARHPKITYNKLLNAFPKQLQKSKGVFATLEKANETYAREGRKRHFIDADEVIELGDGQAVAVSSQWGSGNIDGFIKRAKELGYRID